jgi:hypothetical protein
MPFKSQAQQRAAFGGHLGPEMKRKAPEFAHATPNISKLPQHVREEGMEMGQEPQMQSWDHPGCEDKIGKVFVVLKPSPESSPENLVHDTHAFGIGQFEPSSVHGLYADKNEANLVAEAAQADLHTHLRKVEKKKDQVLDEITKHINKLQKAVNGHMTEASEKPEEADMHHELAQRKMNIIKGLRDKHKAVKATKKELPEIKEK